MRRTLQFAAVLLLSTHVFAQADVGVSIERLQPGPAFQGQPYTYALTVTNAGPQIAHDVTLLWWFTEAVAMPPVPDSRCVLSQSNGFRCTFPGLLAGESVRITTGPMVDTFATAAEVLSMTEHDPNTTNNFVVLHVWPIHILSDLGLNITMPPRINPDATATIRYSIKNQTPGRWPVDVQAKIGLTYATEIVASNAPCVRSAEAEVFAVCTLPTLQPEQTFDLDLTVRFPTPDGRIETTLTPVWTAIHTPGFTIRAGNVYPRTFRVTNASDAGAGSLRQAILDANVECPQRELPCTIAFEIPAPVPASGWFTIKPLTPLPGITAPHLTFDAWTQTAFTGDTNPAGPEIELDGSALTAGNGFFVRTTDTTISGFAIGNFPDNGIFTLRLDVGRAVMVRVEDNFIGVTPNGLPAPNGRGIMIPHGGGEIRNNVIAANRRSGIYAWNGGVFVGGNRIERNGASGIYLGPGSQSTVQSNSITNNREFGVAIAPVDFTQRVALGNNRISTNGLGGIDIGLDGPTLDGPAPVPPVIDAAYFDGRDTYILGHVPPPVLGQISTRYLVELSINEHLDEHGLAEGEQPLGQGITDSDGRFAVVLGGRDLRGLYINGIGTLMTTLYGEFTFSQSSEFGRVKKVE